MKVSELTKNNLTLFNSSNIPNSFIDYLFPNVLNQISVNKFGDKELISELNSQEVIDNYVRNIFFEYEYYIDNLHDTMLVNFDSSFKKSDLISTTSNSDSNSTDSRSTYDNTTLEDVASVKSTGDSRGSSSRTYQDFLPTELVAEHRKISELNFYETVVKCVLNEISIGVWGCG